MTLRTPSRLRPTGSQTGALHDLLSGRSQNLAEPSRQAHVQEFRQHVDWLRPEYASFAVTPARSMIARDAEDRAEYSVVISLIGAGDTVYPIATPRPPTPFPDSFADYDRDYIGWTSGSSYEPAVVCHPVTSILCRASAGGGSPRIYSQMRRSQRMASFVWRAFVTAPVTIA